jgi:hypothetical protein
MICLVARRPRRRHPRRQGEDVAEPTRTQPDGCGRTPQGIRRAAGSARRRSRRRPRKHERERPPIAQPPQSRSPHRVNLHRAHLPRRRLIAPPATSVGLDDEHPVPWNDPTEQHRDGPARFHRTLHIRQPIAPATKQPPPVANARCGTARGKRARHPIRRGAQSARPDPVHLAVHPGLFVGEPCRVRQFVPSARVQHCTRHHRDGRPARDAVALAKMKGRKLHRPSR